MARTPRFLGVHAEPRGFFRVSLAALPFLLLIAVYFYASHIRHLDNPDDKLLPTLQNMWDALVRIAFTRDKRSEEYLMWADTISSLRRLGIGIGLAAIAGLAFGLNSGIFNGMSAVTTPFITFLSIIPPLALLPILFISFGVDEAAKIVLIFIGTFPMLARDIQATVRAIPKEQKTKALTLGASQLALTYRIIMPQVLPRLIDGIRLSLGAAWLFLIASEAIASTDGLGYRIFLVRRYLAMDIIIPYVLWITFLGYTFDFLMQRLIAWAYPWYRDDD